MAKFPVRAKKCKKLISLSNQKLLLSIVHPHTLQPYLHHHVQLALGLCLYRLNNAEQSENNKFHAEEKSAV